MIQTEKKRKKVRIYSFGYAHNGLYPSAPRENELQFIFDVRCLIDPFSSAGIRASGKTKKVKEYILSSSKHWLDTTAEYIFYLMEKFITDEQRDAINIYFMCFGGYQRSVFTARYMKQHLLKKFGRELSFSKVQHLSFAFTLEAMKRGDF